MPLERILTIGVYGFTADRFFGVLADSSTDLFCDLRARRGVRGRDYAFANSIRLQRELAQRGIAYQHYAALVPTPEIRTLQSDADAGAGVPKRNRSELSPRFVERFSDLLDTPEAHAALADIAVAARAPVLCCVERLPQACHRSLVARRLSGGGSIPIQNLTP